MKRIVTLSLAICAFGFVLSLRVSSQAVPQNWQQTLDYAKVQIGRSVPLCGYDQYPRRNYEGSYWSLSNRWDWTCGFWPGCMWKMYELTQDSLWLENARIWTHNLEGNQYFTYTHDIGFQMMCSFGNGNRLAPLPNYQNVIIQSARSLASRWNPNAGSIISWDKAPWHPFKLPVIVDNMMNLELLFYATRLSGDSSFHNMAVAHALKTLETHQRPNGTFYHIVDYDTSGQIVFKGENMSVPLNPETVWARGHGWALYGFVMTYRYAQDPRFLGAATRLADFLVDSLPKDYIPYFMFYPMSNNTNRDASSAAIMLSGLLELYGITGTNKYLKTARHIFKELTSDTFYTEGKSYYSILCGGSENFTDVEKGLIYADYYLLEALIRYKNLFPDSFEAENTLKNGIQPFANGLNVQAECIADLEITNLTGVVVYKTGKIHLVKGYNALPLKNLIPQKGIYIIRIKTDKGDVMTIKILIH